MKSIKIFEDFNTSNITNIGELINKLREYKVPIDYWGTGKAKTVEHLLDELNNDECTIIDEGGYLVRYIEFVGVMIYYIDKEGNTHVLKEDKQEFKDGRTRKRSMVASVTEKMKFGEDPLMSAIRGVKEELGIKLSNDQLTKMRDLSYDGGSQSYPGLKTKYKGHQFTCFLTDAQFKPNGYIEVQKDKSTFFVWHKKEQ